MQAEGWCRRGHCPQEALGRLSRHCRCSGQKGPGVSKEPLRKGRKGRNRLICGIGSFLPPTAWRWPRVVGGIQCGCPSGLLEVPSGPLWPRTQMESSVLCLGLQLGSPQREDEKGRMRKVFQKLSGWGAGAALRRFQLNSRCAGQFLCGLWARDRDATPGTGAGLALFRPRHRADPSWQHLCQRVET